MRNPLRAGEGRRQSGLVLDPKIFRDLIGKGLSEKKSPVTNLQRAVGNLSA